MRYERHCSKCNTVKAVTEFVTDQRMPDGVRGVCQECHFEPLRAGWHQWREKFDGNQRHQHEDS